MIVSRTPLTSTPTLITPGLLSDVAGVLCLFAAALVLFAYRQAGERSAQSSHAARNWSGILTRDIVLLGISGAVLPLGQFCLITYLALYLKETQNVPIEVSAGLLVGAPNPAPRSPTFTKEKAQ